MVAVEYKIKVYKEDKIEECLALFDTGYGGSYFSKDFAEKIGYESYKKIKEIPLAVKGKVGEIIGDVTVYLEIEGFILPERETLGVIEDLIIIDAIIGRNIMEKYGIFIEEDKIKLKHSPPTSFII